MFLTDFNIHQWSSPYILYVSKHINIKLNLSCQCVNIANSFIKEHLKDPINQNMVGSE